MIDTFHSVCRSKLESYHCNFNSWHIYNHLYLVPFVLVPQLILQDGGDAGGGPGGIVLGGVR